MRFGVEIEFYADLPYHIIGMHIRDGRGTDIIAVNTYQERLAVPPVKSGDRLFYTFDVPIELRPGNYSISSTVAYDQYKLEWMDWIDNLILFRIIDPDPTRLIFGTYYPGSLKVALGKPPSLQSQDSSVSLVAASTELQRVSSLEVG